MNPDHINGAFELIGSASIWINVFRLYRDKKLAGVSWLPTLFFTSWGLWNLFYYPSLHQWWSFAGGASIVVVNAVWLGLVFRYRGRA